ncbi:AMP-binding protein [Nocardia sp. NPDC004860]|uniref:AMP-binding protein n=1 Tax=Nocardia sp. NPDC004860 TaxID=3154557 RepID=UPI0033BAEE86
MIYRSESVTIDIPSRTVSAHVLERAQELGGKPALIDGVTGETITYAELEELTARGAAGLTAAGIRPGDVVALASHNQPSWVVVAHAVLRAGAVLTPLNPILTATEISKQLTDSGAKAVVTSAEARDTVFDAAERAAVQRRFVLSSDDPESFSSLLQSQPSAEAAIDPATALAALPYSSGTTGASKGVMLSHRNLVANLEQIRYGWTTDGSDVVCAALPFFHIYGFTVVLNSSLLAGATIVTMPRFDMNAYLRIVQDYKVTVGHLAPPMVLALAHAPEVDQYDLSSMRFAISGAAPLDEEAVARAQKRTGIVIRQGFGMTEASPATHMVFTRDFESTPAGSVGRLVAGTEARIVDPLTGTDAAPGERGELLVRGPQVMRGYLGRPEATSATIVDGWLYTGDIAVVDGDDFYIVDRIKELIKYKGYQIAPAELEALLLTHPLISDAAVIGVPDAAGGEIPKAFVVRSGDLEAHVLMDWVAAQVAPYKRIRRLEFVDTIPKSPAGKILRRVLRDSEADAAERTAPESNPQSAPETEKDSSQ